MRDYRKEYAMKLRTAAEAVQAIKSGDRIVLPLGCGEPPALLEAMAARKDELEGVIVDQMLPLRKYTYMQEGMEKHFRHNSWFISGASRQGVNQGRMDFTPNFFHEAPRIYRDFVPVDVVMAVVSPMDKHGYFSLGVSVDYTSTVARLAKTLIVEVNEHMPRTHGESFIHISEVDYIVEHNEPLITLPPQELSEADKAIGAYIAELIEDGSTIQLGIGSMPNAVAQMLLDKKCLGIHSEMLTDSMVDLVEAGAVDNSVKSLHPGKIVGSFAVGTQRLYDFLDDNPMIEMHPVSYTNDPYVIAMNNKMVAINATVEVDLLGQCASESIGTYQYSGTGGQVDFIRGAERSPGGKGIICLHSTAKGGTVSKIVPALQPGAVVTTSKNEVNYVVTEYGVAQLKGKSARERALALINIAHPDFRAELRKEAERRNLL